LDNKTKRARVCEEQIAVGVGAQEERGDGEAEIGERSLEVGRRQIG
jgi:hypothetical protein